MPQDKEIKKQRSIEAWKRFAARFIDIFFISIILGFLLGLMIARYSLNISMVELNNYATIVIFFVWVFCESLLLSTWGTTPGKFLFNITLKDAKGKKPQFSHAFRRSFLVYVLGLIIGIPIIMIVGMTLSFISYVKNGITQWDKMTQMQLSFGEISTLKKIIIVIILAIIIATTIFYK